MASNYPDASASFLEQPRDFQLFLRSMRVLALEWDRALETERGALINAFDTANRMRKRAEILEAARHE